MVQVTADDVAAALREARNRQLVDQLDDRVYAFSHDKLRETTYAALPATRLRELHLAAAVAIEQRYAGSPEFPDHFAAIALHYQRAQDLARAIDYLDKAAQVAWSKSANREAIAFLKDAIEHVGAAALPVDDLRFARWHRQIGDALWSLGRPEESAHYLRRAAGLLGHPAPVGRFRLVGSILKHVCRQVLHRLFLDRFLGSKRKQAERLMEAARAHERLQEVLYFSGDALAMLHASVSNLNLGEMAGTSAELTTSYVNAFAVAGIIPARKLAAWYQRRAAEISERFPHPAILSYFRMLSGVYAIGTADWDTAKRELSEGMELARKLGFRRRFEDNCFIDSVRDFFQGNFSQALSSAVTVYASASRGDQQTQSWALIQRACVHLVQNQVDEALNDLQEAAAIVGEHQSSRVEYLWFHSVLARALLRKGDRTGALASANRAYARMVKTPPLYFAWIEALPALAEVFLEASKGSAGRDATVLARQLARTCATMRAQARVFPTAEPQSHLWLGHLRWLRSSPRDAVLSWQRALDRARALQMPYEEAGALRALAQATPQSGEERQRFVDQANGIFQRLGAEFDLAQRPVQPAAALSA
jgi:tetratricopeptide (TPR) repeat protein